MWSLLLACAMGAAPAVWGAQWYVSPAGDDAGGGSIGSPFRTIQQALSVAQPGDTVYVRTGVYAERVRFPAGGLAGQPIRLRNYPGEQAVIDGAGLTVGTGRDSRLRSTTRESRCREIARDRSAPTGPIRRRAPAPERASGAA